MRLRALRLAGAAGLVATMVLVVAAPASAHVTADPSSAPQGGEITLVFRVPNEAANTNVTQVQVAFPTDHPLLGVDTEPLPGWTAKVTEVKLNPPVQTDDGPVSQAVSQVSWTAGGGGGTGPGQFQEFTVLVQRLPTDTTKVTFPTIQTYSDGQSVAWIDPVDANHPNPDHPSPSLVLTVAGNGSAAGSSTAGGSNAGTTKFATTSAVTTAQRLGIIGVLAGALALAVAGFAFSRRHSN